MKMAWVRLTIWCLLSLLVPLLAWMGLRVWIGEFLSEVKSVFVVQGAVWMLIMFGFVAGQITRGITMSGWDVWSSFMGPVELHTLASRLESVAKRKEAMEIYSEGETNGKERIRK
jgi:predicted Na+-dependent transporter